MRSFIVDDPTGFPFCSQGVAYPGPEGPGLRRQGMIKSFETYVTRTGYGVVGFDKYGDRGMVIDRSNHPAEAGEHHGPKWQAVPDGTPGAKTVDEMMELAEVLAQQVLAEYELPQERLTIATDVVANIPTEMSERTMEGTATASKVAAPSP